MSEWMLQIQVPWLPCNGMLMTWYQTLCLHWGGSGFQTTDRLLNTSQLFTLTFNNVFGIVTQLHSPIGRLNHQQAVQQASCPEIKWVILPISICRDSHRLTESAKLIINILPKEWEKHKRQEHRLSSIGILRYRLLYKLLLAGFCHISISQGKGPWTSVLKTIRLHSALVVCMHFSFRNDWRHYWGFWLEYTQCQPKKTGCISFGTERKTGFKHIWETHRWSSFARYLIFRHKVSFNKGNIIASLGSERRQPRCRQVPYMC